MRLSGVITIWTALASLGLSGCSEPRTLLEKVQRDGELRVLTRSAATTYYEGPLGPTGPEYELAKRFADQLGVRLDIAPLGTVGEVLSRVRRGEAHFAAAGLTVTEDRRRWARFTPPYQHVAAQVIYRSGRSPVPGALEDLSEGYLEVVSDSSHAERLRELKREHERLAWSENDQRTSEELLTLVAEQVIDFTVVDSHEFALHRRFYPELKVAFDLDEPQPLAWAFPPGPDSSLYDAASEFLQEMQDSGELARLLDRHYSHVKDYDYAGSRLYLRHVRQRLPTYREHFERAAEDNRLDWQLLAAMAYQESHWNPDAVSPTGVRGIMMLTMATARYLGIEQRTDPIQSITGGARYLRWLMDTVPAEIPEPDRTWLAVAAYNVGLGHVHDAREIAQRLGKDPNKWGDVKDILPLLRQRKWYEQTRHGYARGNEPVRYVENIRSYYDILRWELGKSQQPRKPPPRALSVTAPVL